MKETGLMFKAPLVRAIMGDLKTQTRRTFSEHMMKLMRAAAAIGEVSHFLDEGRLQTNDLEYVQQFSPVGQPGDRIYVRETFNHFERNENFKPGCECFYRADGDCVDLQPWRPAIHMPKHAARIWLEVTDLRVERLQQITEADCVAEGATGGHGSIPDYAYSATPIEHFRYIWESTGGDWEANPWVWVIDFKRIENEHKKESGNG